MECADKRIRRTGDDGTALDALACFFVRPLVPQASHHHAALVRHRNGVWLLLGLLPFVEPISDDEAPLALPPRVPECGGGINRLCPCIDRRKANLDVLRPPRD